MSRRSGCRSSLAVAGPAGPSPRAGARRDGRRSGRDRRSSSDRPLRPHPTAGAGCSQCRGGRGVDCRRPHRASWSWRSGRDWPYASSSEPAVALRLCAHRRSGRAAGTSPARSRRSPGSVAVRGYGRPGRHLLLPLGSFDRVRRGTVTNVTASGSDGSGMRRPTSTSRQTSCHDCCSAPTTSSIGRMIQTSTSVTAGTYWRYCFRRYSRRSSPGDGAGSSLDSRSDRARSSRCGGCGRLPAERAGKFGSTRSVEGAINVVGDRLHAECNASR